MLKAICGFREDQEVPVPTDDAHRAYYVYLTPGARTVLSNGYTLRHDEVQRIAPDFHAAMGWNRNYKMGPDDYREIERTGTDGKLKSLMARASDTARLAQSDQRILAAPLSVDNLLGAETTRA